MNKESNDSGEPSLFWTICFLCFPIGGIFFFLDLFSVLMFSATVTGEMKARWICFACLMVVALFNWLKSAESPGAFGERLFQGCLLAPFLSLPVFGLSFVIQKVGLCLMIVLTAFSKGTLTLISDFGAGVGSFLGAAGENVGTVLSRNGQWILVVLAAVVSVLLYFVPAITALRRGKRNAVAIFVLNLFLGWTLLGWVLALVWAWTHDD